MPAMRSWISRAFILATLFATRSALAQRPVSLQQAIDSALVRGPRVAVTRADSALAAARILTARAYPNPLASFTYSKAVPEYHFEIEQPFEYPFLRRARIRAARASLAASTIDLKAERASIRYDVEAAYATAAGAIAIRAIEARNAADAQELVRLAQARERAGDASELDVRLAAVAAGQAQNMAASDSLTAIRAILDLQALMGMATDSVSIVPSDTFELAIVPAPVQLPLRVASAEQTLASEQATFQVARYTRIPVPSIRAGVEWHDPDQHGALPTVGISIPLPLWDRNRGGIAEARAATARANATLTLVRLQAKAALTLATRERDLLRTKVERGRQIIREAQKVAELSLIAYREGEFTLLAVLEAQRNARDAIRSFIEDVQASRIAEAAFNRAQVVGGSPP